ncbi:hypothetical protein [Geobacter sp. SVR]|uniref:hypothetical protein n=1 Tax=Geobacter sp. SVR TaxID=2495594 RepID=UPI00143EFBA9|nr:hypothetical protein [Geobacter sp. SVR]BCS54108.1 hypothetical protein GSVR_24160 [Geobacter sp. SVR]GCF87591.1 hypothetical protein GSbR_41910 [Geobacter sp. SVR]
MARELFRRLVDKEGNSYYVAIPSDVNVDNFEDVMLGMHQNIVRLQGYKLASEGTIRLPDNTETDGKALTFHKKLHVYDEFPGVDPKDFADAIHVAFERARQQSINRPEITTYEGKPIIKDATGAYINWSVTCYGCGKELKGRRPISYRDGVPTRAQMFVPEDSGVTQYRPGSKLKLCPACSVKSVPIPEVAAPVEAQPPFLPAQEAQASPVEEPKLKIRVEKLDLDDDLRELMDLAGPKSQVSPEYLKGVVYGMMRARLRK